MKYLFFCWLVLASVVGNAQNGLWSELYGDDSFNIPQAIKGFDDGAYLAATVVRPGIMEDQTFATFTKFDLTTGQLIWELELDFPSVINDFTYVPEEDAFLLVGRSDPFDAFIDGSSFILKVDDTGQLLPGLGIDQNGREQLTKIVRHEEATNPEFPYYAVGGFTPQGAANAGRDITVLFNLDADRNINWRKEYLAVDGQELESGRGLFPGANGNLFLLGNDIKWNNTDPDFANNNGTMIHVNGSGEVLKSLYYPGEIDWWDGKAITEKTGVFVGHRFGVDEGYVGLVDLTNGTIRYGLRFPELKAIRNLVVTGNERVGVILFAATFKDATRKENHLVRIRYNLPLDEPLVVTRFARHEELAERVEPPLLHQQIPSNLIVYADGRQKVGGASVESLIQGMDPGLNAACLLEVEGVWDTLTVPHIPFNVIVEEDDYDADFFDIMAADPDLNCEVTCGPPDTCSITLDATIEQTDGCFEVNLIATPTGGTGPYIISWDIGCDMLDVMTTTQLTIPYTFSPAQDYTACVTITDAEGCTDSIMIEGVLDDEPPIITGCTDMLVNLPTDPGLCTAVFDANDYISATDNCSEVLLIESSIRLDRSAGRTANPLTLDPGTTDILINVTDEAGNLEQCTIDVLVVDQQAPTCPTPPVVQATANPCGEPVIVSFPDPVFTDNCPGDITVNVTSMPSSGDVFPIGTTPVTFSGTDDAGNVGSCTVNVVVAESCGEILSSALNCRSNGNYQLVIDFNNGLPITSVSCGYEVVVDETFVDQTGPVTFVNGMLVIDIFTDELFLEATATVQLVSNCPCPNGMTTDCSFTFEAPVECCLELSVPDTTVCADETFLELPILGLDQLVSPYDIQQVRYYVSDICTFGGAAFQITNGYQPLTLAPNFHTGDICVYAEVDLAGGGACSTVRTEIARVLRCNPIVGTIPSQQFCFSGDLITPAPLELTLNGGDPNVCGADIQWFDPAGNPIPNATDLSYQPDALSLPAGTVACDERFTYRAEITSICGTTSATATIRLFNEDAPNGELTIDAPDVPPLCPGEDAVIRYDQACTGDEMMWQWWERTTNTTYAGLPTNGTQNPVYFTNRMYEDTWFLVTKTNGSCPADSIEIFVDIADPLQIIDFSADYNVACQPDFLVLDVTFSSQPGCADSVFYYRNGLLLASQPVGSSAYEFAPMDDDISGNYYAIVRDTCCNLREQTEVVTVKNPPSIAIGGPCFLCNSDENDLPSTLTALPTGVAEGDVTLEWFVDGVPFGPPNVPTVDIFDDDGDVYTLQMTTANGCVYTASFTPYKRCFVVGVDDLIRVEGKVFPNPATDQLIIETERATRFREITLYDALGRPVKTIAPNGLLSRTTISLDGLPKGVYVLQAFTESGALLAREIVKE